jgi:hypothetical protein
VTVQFDQNGGLQAVKTFELGVKEDHNLISELEVGKEKDPEQLGLALEMALTLTNGSGLLLA